MKALLVLVGMVIGGVVASAVFLLLMHRQQQDHIDEIAALKLAADEVVGLKAIVGQNLLNPFGANDPAKGNGNKPTPEQKKSDSKYTPDEQKIVDLCQDLVRDFEKNRMSSVYRLTSATYQKQTDRKMFDAKFAKDQMFLQGLTQLEKDRDHKLTKLSGDKGYDFYFTARNPSYVNQPLVNFTFTMIQENGEWRIDDVELSVNR